MKLHNSVYIFFKPVQKLCNEALNATQLLTVIVQYVVFKIEGSTVLKSCYDSRTLHGQNSIIPEHKVLFGAKYLWWDLDLHCMLCELLNQADLLKSCSASPNLGEFDKLTNSPHTSACIN